MKHKLAVLSLLMLWYSVFLSGCWSAKAPESLGMVSIWGVDMSTENGEDTYYEWIRMLQPAGKAMPNGEKAKGGSPEILIKGSGSTERLAVSDAIQRLPRTPYYESGTAVIFGEKFVREKFAESVELSLRSPQVRSNMSFFIVKGKVNRVIQANPIMLPTLSDHIKKQVMETALPFGTGVEVTIKQFIEWWLSPDRDAIMPVLDIRTPEKGEMVPESVVLDGLAVFRGVNLAGWLNKTETIGYLLITQKIKKAQIEIRLTQSDKRLTYILTDSKSKIKASMIDGKPHFKITIKAQGAILETGGLNITAQNAKPLEKLAGEKIREVVLGTIAKAKEYESDCLGLMQKLHRYNPSAWKKLTPNWRESFRGADVEVEVEAKIVNTGVMIKALK